MRSDDDDRDEPTGELPAASPDDPRVTITGADRAADAAPWVDEETLLPHWTDAPTGQVPVVVARESAPSDDPWAQIPAPAWREGEADWVAHEDQFDASFLGTQREAADTRPWEFDEAAAVAGGDRDGPPRAGAPRAARPGAPPVAGQPAGRARGAPAPRGLDVAGHADRGPARDGRRRGLHRRADARRGPRARRDRRSRPPRPTPGCARSAPTRPRSWASSRS